jgi:hypothetical protein
VFFFIIFLWVFIFFCVFISLCIFYLRVCVTLLNYRLCCLNCWLLVSCWFCFG